jgi:hypothetical protein
VRPSKLPAQLAGRIRKAFYVFEKF